MAMILRHTCQALKGNWKACDRHNLHQKAHERFRTILGEKGVLTDADTVASFNADWTGNFCGNANTVLAPASTAEVSQVLQICNANRQPVVPMGGNTGLTGAAVAQHGEVILSMSRMNRILDFHEGGCLVCESGAILETLDNYAAERGYRMPLDLGAKGSCQIGGNLATNAGGLRFLRYGSLRGSTLGLEAVLPDGTVLDSLKTLRKDNTGYDLKQLFIGSEGTLGVITKVAIQCVPSSSSVNTLLLAVDSFPVIQEVFKLANEHLAEVLSAFEFFDAQGMDLAMQHIPGAQDPFPQRSPMYILVETSGSNAGHDLEKLEAFVEACNSRGPLTQAAVIAQDLQQSANIWHIREGISEALRKHGRVHKYDLSMAAPQMYTLVESVRQRLESMGEGLVVCGYGHYSDGNLHLNVSDSQEGRAEEVHRVLEPFVYDWTSAVGGSVSAEHGIGLLKRDALRYSQSQPALQLMRQLKQLIDPQGIMNPGKVL